MEPKISKLVVDHLISDLYDNVEFTEHISDALIDPIEINALCAMRLSFPVSGCDIIGMAQVELGRDLTAEEVVKVIHIATDSVEQNYYWYLYHMVNDIVTATLTPIDSKK